MTEDIKTLKILIPIHLLPNDTSFHTLYFESLFDALRKKTSLEVVWLVYMDKKQKKIKNEFFETIDIHDFDNAVEVIKTVNPDVVFAYAGGPQGQIHHALSLAAKAFNIPVVSLIIIDETLGIRRSKYLKSNITRFFENSEHADSDEKVVMGKGKFFIYKTLFLIKTLGFLKISKKEITNTLIELLYSFRSNAKNDFNPQYENDLHLLESKKLLEPILDAGFKKESLEVVGNPVYDKAFKRIQQFSHSAGHKTRILLMTSPVVEHGILPKNERNKIVEEIVKKYLENSNEMELIIKIHPYNENLSEYQEIVRKLNADIEVKKDGDILDYLEKSDVVLTYTSQTTSALFALIAKKPIVICNFYKIHNDRFLDLGLAIECKEPENIIPSVKNAFSNPLNNGKIDEYVRDALFKPDGDSGKRVALSLLNFLQNRKL